MSPSFLHRTKSFMMEPHLRCHHCNVSWLSFQRSSPHLTGSLESTSKRLEERQNTENQEGGHHKEIRFPYLERQICGEFLQKSSLLVLCMEMEECQIYTLKNRLCCYVLPVPITGKKGSQDFSGQVDCEGFVVKLPCPRPYQCDHEHRPSVPV